MASLIPVFSLSLNHKIACRLFTVGKYSDKNPNITGATLGDKVLVHSLNSHSSFGDRIDVASQSGVSVLSINQAVCSLKAGRLDPASTKDILVVGSHADVLAYDVLNNKDIFHKEVLDGAYAIVIGCMTGIKEPMVIVGGNCSIQGFDFSGKDCYWTVTGDFVRSLALHDFYGDNTTQLIAGSEDFDIRVFQKDEIIAEINELGAVWCLTSMAGGCFGYAVTSGTTGVYREKAREWRRILSGCYPVTTQSFDLNGDGIEELITGWGNGSVEARSSKSGKLIFVDNFNDCIAGIEKADYYQTSKELLICCSIDGEIRGYPVVDVENCKGQSLLANKTENDKVRKLLTKKQDLLTELATYNESKKTEETENIDLRTNAIPANTGINCSLLFKKPYPDCQQGYYELSISLNNETIVKAVQVFAEGVFENAECYCVHPPLDSLSSIVQIPVFPIKDFPVELCIRAFVGYRNSHEYLVLEEKCNLKRYSACRPDVDWKMYPAPTCKVAFEVRVHINRIVSWFNDNFPMVEDLKATEMPIEVRFVYLRNMMPLYVKVESASLDVYRVTLESEDMDFVGDIIHHFCTSLHIDELKSIADFPSQYEFIQNALNVVHEYQWILLKYSGDIADACNEVKSLIIRTEDARLLGELSLMKHGYKSICACNKDLKTLHDQRWVYHQELLTYLQSINKIIDRAARLRYGKCKIEVVNGCREAIKDKNFARMFNILKYGSDQF